MSVRLREIQEDDIVISHSTAENPGWACRPIFVCFSCAFMALLKIIRHDAAAASANPKTAWSLLEVLGSLEEIDSSCTKFLQYQ